MKAIIVIDLNDTTLNEWDTDTSKCWAEVVVYTPIRGGAHGIGRVYANDNVELKPLPQKQGVKSIEFIPKGMWGEYENRCFGWNACLDEILGEDK